MASHASKRRKRLLYILIPLILVGLVLVRLGRNKQEARSAVYHHDPEEAILVQVDTLRMGAASEPWAWTGSFEPDRETKLSAEVQGKISDMLVEVGDRVSKGQALVQQDRSLLQLQLQGVEVQLEGLQADVARFTVLAEADAIQGVQLEKARLGLRSAEVQKATLLEQIAKTTIRAPFDGIVTAKLAEAGAFAAPGMPLLQITDIGRLRFTVHVPEGDLPRFRMGADHRIMADNQPDGTLMGQVVMVGSKANRANQYPVQLLVPNTPSWEIRAGMFGKVHAERHGTDEGIVIPASAISGGDRQQVYLVRDGKAVVQPISVAAGLGDRIVVAQGLNDGDVLITKGFINLFDGAPVAVQATHQP